MDEETKAYFNALLDKPVGELTPEEKAFLQARQSYMGRKTKEDYADILKEKVTIEDKPEPVANTNPHPSEDEDGEVEE